MTQEPNLSDLKNFIGQRVIIGCNIHGILRYFGATHFSEAACCGIELDLEVGNNNGSVDGIRYFTCKENYGIFIPANEAEIINDESGPYLKVSTFLPAVIENFIPNKATSFDHEENLSPKTSSQDDDSDESLGILPHLRSLDELIEWDDLFYDNAVIISTRERLHFGALPLSNNNNLESLKNDKNISNTDPNAITVHDQIAVSNSQTISILSLDDLSVFHDGDECHENLNTTVVLKGNTVESDENQRDLNTTIVLSDRQVDFENQKHDKLASDQTFASNEAVNENKTYKDLNSTVVFPHRSIEAGNEFCMDLNTTVVLTDKPEEVDKNIGVASFSTEEVSCSPVNVFLRDLPTFASTPKQEINFSFFADERDRPSLPSCSSNLPLSYLEKKEKMEAIPYEKNVAEHLSPIKPDDMILVDNELEPINKYTHISPHIPLPSLNETFDYAKFSTEEKVTQDFKESAFTCEMNIPPDEPDADVCELHKEEDAFSVSKNILNSPHNVEKALDTNILKQEMNILNITHSVHEELEDKIGVLNLQENASEYGEIKVLDTTFQKVTDTQKSSKVCSPKPCKKVEISKVTPKTGRKLSIPFIRRDTTLSKEQTEKKCIKFDKNKFSRKSVSHFGSSNFTNTEPRSTESQNRRNTLSSNKNLLLKNDEIKTIISTSQKNISSKDSIKENNNKNAASQQKHQIDTRHANITMIVKEKNERNIMSEDELGNRFDNVIQKTSKNISGDNETKVITHSMDKVIPRKSCEKDVKEKKETLGLIDSEKTNLPLPAPRSQHKIKSIPCLKTRMPVPTFRAKSTAATSENVACPKFSTKGTTKMTDKSPASLVKKPSLKKPSVAALVEKKSAIVRISEKCVSQKTITDSNIPSSSKPIRKLDIRNITICKKENEQETDVDVPLLPEETVSIFPSKDVSQLPKKSATSPSMMAAAHLPETVPVDTNLPKKPVTCSLKATTLALASLSKKSEIRPPKPASRIPQRASLRNPRAVGLHPRGMVSNMDPNRTITIPSSQSVTRALPVASKEKSATEKESPKKSQFMGSRK